MINRNTLIGLAVATVVLFAGAAVIGEDNDVLWIVDDIVWFGFLACALALVVLTVAVLVKAATRSRGSAS
jgi:hypothetical protein